MFLIKEKAFTDGLDDVFILYPLKNKDLVILDDQFWIDFHTYGKIIKRCENNLQSINQTDR